MGSGAALRGIPVYFLAASALDTPTEKRLKVYLEIKIFGPPGLKDASLHSAMALTMAMVMPERHRQAGHSQAKHFYRLLSAAFKFPAAASVFSNFLSNVC